MHFIKVVYFEWYCLKSLEILAFQKSGFQDLTEYIFFFCLSWNCKVFFFPQEENKKLSDK